jgi:phage gp36-like protein
MWREITEEDILSVLNSTEAAVYQNTLAGDDQDVLDEITIKVVQHARGYIADHPANQLAAGDTLPDRCIRPACHLIRKDLLTRLDMELSEDRRRDATEALRFFERVADGKVTIEAPDGATEDSGSTPRMETIASRDRIATRQKLSGL